MSTSNKRPRPRHLSSIDKSVQKWNELKVGVLKDLIASEDDNFGVYAQLERLSMDQTGVQDYQNKGIHFAIECIEEAIENGYLVYFLKLTYDKNGNVVNEEQVASLIHTNRECHFCIANEDTTSEHKGRHLRPEELRDMNKGEVGDDASLAYKVRYFSDGFKDGDYLAYLVETISTLVGRTYGASLCLNRNYFAGERDIDGTNTKLGNTHDVACLFIDPKGFMSPTSKIRFNEAWQYAYGPNLRRHMLTPIKIDSVGFDGEDEEHQKLKMVTVERTGGRGQLLTKDDIKARREACNFYKHLPAIEELGKRGEYFVTLPDDRRVFIGPTRSADSTTHTYLAVLRRANVDDWRVKLLASKGLSMDGYEEAQVQVSKHDNYDSDSSDDDDCFKGGDFSNETLDDVFANQF